MVNSTDVLNNSLDLNKGFDYVSWLSKTISEEIVNFLSNQGLEVSVRWVSVLMIFLSIGLIFIGMKIGKPLAKWVLIFLGGALLLGLIIPVW